MHRSVERDPAARGHGLGCAQRDAVRHTVAIYARMLREVVPLGPAELEAAGRSVGLGLERTWPDLLDELEGMAAGAGVPAQHLLAINARTELLAPAVGGECSLIAETTASGSRIAQNWDWHPALASRRCSGTCSSPAAAGSPR